MPVDGNVRGRHRSPRMTAVRWQHVSNNSRVLKETSRRRYDGLGLIASGILPTIPLPGWEMDVSLQGLLIAVLARGQEEICILILDE